MTEFGIIGFGRFGQLAASILRPHMPVIVCDSRDITADAARIGVTVGSLETVASCRRVMVAVPVQALRDTLKQIAPYVQPGALIMDVASVKMLPAQWMRDILPNHVDIVATHPLFGPQSAQRGLVGQPMVVCPVRGDRHETVAEFARSIGLAVSITTPDEHDREMAYVQALTHLIGRSLSNIKIPDEELKTNSYQHLLDLCALIGDDTEELFFAIQNLNPFAREITGQFLGEANRLIDRSIAAAELEASV